MDKTQGEQRRDILPPNCKVPPVGSAPAPALTQESRSPLARCTAVSGLARLHEGQHLTQITSLIQMNEMIAGKPVQPAALPVFMQ